MSALQIFGLIVALVVIGAIYEQNRKRRSQAGASLPTPAPVSAAPWSPVGKWSGQLVPGSSGTWGGANDEHSKDDTDRTLAERPDWRGLGYCPGGVFEFIVHPDGLITGAANIYGTNCPVQGRPAIALDGRKEIEFIVMAHMVRLKFDGDSVGGLLWEGHDTLKRANIVGRRA